MTRTDFFHIVASARVSTLSKEKKNQKKKFRLIVVADLVRQAWE